MFICSGSKLIAEFYTVFNNIQGIAIFNVKFNLFKSTPNALFEPFFFLSLN